MKALILIICLFLLTFTSCVSKSEYDELAQENRELKSQIDELEHGAPKLLAQAQKFRDEGDFEFAREKLDSLFSRHSETQEAIAGKRLQQDMLDTERDIADDNAWKSFAQQGTAEAYNAYISKYPNGRNVPLAQYGLQNLEKKQRDEETAKRQEEYNQALAATDSYTIRQFIEQNPNHPAIKSFRKRLIQAEVNEIAGDANTGQMPAFKSLNFGYSHSKVSRVSIKNDTQCTLVVRYSGNDVKMVEIVPGRTNSVALSSGSYRIAASACGSNYAGTEDLHGRYSSSYYIVSSTYRY